MIRRSSRHLFSKRPLGRLGRKLSKRVEARLYPRRLEAFAGLINADIYRDIAREAVVLNKALSKRRTDEKGGRPPKNTITIPEAKAIILRLLTRCHQSFVPPPLDVIEALERAWPSVTKGKSVQHRAGQMQKTAEIEAEHLVWEGIKSEFGINPSALGKASNTDKNTIIAWRENSSVYRQAVVDVVAARIAASLPNNPGYRKASAD